MCQSIKVGGFLPNSLVNGEGIRSVVFFQGCARACPGCHNTNLQRFNSDQSKTMPVSQVVDMILENKEIIDGVTISGGDAIYQYDGLLELCRELKKHNINIWLYTGAEFEELVFNYKEIIECVDVIVDGMYVEELKNERLKYRGSSNQNIIYLDNGKVVKTIGGEADN